MTAPATVPERGITREAHVCRMLDRSAATIAEVTTAIDGKLTKRQREQLWRRLAGVVGDCESVRLWLEKGAPR